jgi:hypothetical protein
VTSSINQASLTSQSCDLPQAGHAFNRRGMLHFPFPRSCVFSPVATGRLVSGHLMANSRICSVVLIERGLSYTILT